MTDPAQSNSLTDLATRIRAEHEDCRVALIRGVGHAMTAGTLLIEAKAQLEHGQWRPWLRDQCEMPERTARLYMRLARHREQIESKTATVADLTVRQAVALISAGPNSFAGKAADSAIDDFDLATYEAAEAARAVRAAAYSTIEAAIAKIVERGELIAAAVWDERLLSAIDDCKSELQADCDEPFALSPKATAAMQDAQAIAIEMLSRAEGP